MAGKFHGPLTKALPGLPIHAASLCTPQGRMPPQVCKALLDRIILFPERQMQTTDACIARHLPARFCIKGIRRFHDDPPLKTLLRHIRKQRLNAAADLDDAHRFPIHQALVNLEHFFPPVIHLPRFKILGILQIRLLILLDTSHGCFTNPSKTSGSRCAGCRMPLSMM